MYRYLLCALFLTSVSGCGCTYVDPGHVGVYVDRTGGVVRDEPLGPGYHTYPPVTAEIIEYPIFMQTVVYSRSSGDKNEEVNVTTIESQTISFDVSLSFELDPKNVPKLYQRFRRSITDVTHSFVRQTIREALQEVVGQMHVLDVLGPQKFTINEKVMGKLRNQLDQYGFVIRQFTLNEVRPPETILKAIEAKNAMEQEALRAQNEQKKKEYEGQQLVITAEAEARAITARAKAQADANKIIADSISPTLVNYLAVQKWNGQLPQSTGGVLPFMNLNREAK